MLFDNHHRCIDAFCDLMSYMTKDMFNIPFSTFVAHYYHFIIMVVNFSYQFVDNTANFKTNFIFQIAFFQFVCKRLHFFNFIFFYLIEPLAVEFYITGHLIFSYNVKNRYNRTFTVLRHFRQLAWYIFKRIPKIIGQQYLFIHNYIYTSFNLNYTLYKVNALFIIIPSV